MPRTKFFALLWLNSDRRRKASPVPYQNLASVPLYPIRPGRGDFDSMRKSLERVFCCVARGDQNLHRLKGTKCDAVRFYRDEDRSLNRLPIWKIRISWQQVMGFVDDQLMGTPVPFTKIL